MVQSAANPTNRYNIEQTVLERYQDGAKAVQPSLCCPTSYDADYLQILPQEIIEKDYGCGDPSRHVRAGETVLDLGSGAGKICYILAQKVGVNGKVIGVDFNDEMLNLARKYQGQIGETLGYNNVTFVKGKIQDLQLNLAKLETWLKTHPVQTLEDLSACEQEGDRLRREEPLIPDNSVDVVVSNCVLNLVKPTDKDQLFREIFRILKAGGRAIISDIVCDEDPTESILNDPDLWSGCIAGAFREDEFLKRFEVAGFYGVEILERQTEPWQVIDGIEFRSLTVRAYKGKEGECWERKQAVVYRGPWKQVMDDDGHIFCRGERMAVCDKTFQIMTNNHSPYQADIIGLEPQLEISLAQAKPFDCNTKAIRHAREMKDGDYRVTTINENDCCSPGECC
jgi:SAM-dependent methyltransferase